MYQTLNWLHVVVVSLCIRTWSNIFRRYSSMETYFFLQAYTRRVDELKYHKIFHIDNIPPESLLGGWHWQALVQEPLLVVRTKVCLLDGILGRAHTINKYLQIITSGVKSMTMRSCFKTFSKYLIIMSSIPFIYTLMKIFTLFLVSNFDKLLILMYKSRDFNVQISWFGQIFIK